MSNPMLLGLGAEGAAVSEVRARLAHLGLLDEQGAGSFDETVAAGVRTFQQERGLTVDGMVGPDTYRRLEEARWQLGDRVLTYVPGHLVTGDDVAALQRRLNQLGFDAGRPDGMFGPRTDASLRDFQGSVGVVVDGTCGPDTYRAFDRLVRTISGGNASSLRDRITMSALRTGVSDKVVVIDPGLDGGSPVCEAIATRVEGRLAALGTQVLLTRAGSRGSLHDEADRAAFANRTAADLLVSIHCDEASSPLPTGVACFYFGEPTGGAHSASGELLASMIQDEVCARTGLLDCRTHPRTWDLLRMTRMAAVRLEVGNLANMNDAELLSTIAMQDSIAEGIASAIIRFCAPAQ
ncbi:MAG: N-acetylmuramoyl-L-alanine amidase [Actinobacteria bacterium]|nr:N-acetylmuramoyl-L-alanine amidase [Actinomycetota bacterium]